LEHSQFTGLSELYFTRLNKKAQKLSTIPNFPYWVKIDRKKQEKVWEEQSINN
jgi:hypothetical protein